MGREVRRVPKDWQHPKNEHGHYIPLYDGADFSRQVKEWDEGAAKWAEGLRDDWSGGWTPLEDDEKDMTFEDWCGPRPEAKDYMPEWPERDRTHLMMYEDTSEGTPISPAFETPEELARWLADNNASAFADMTATYEQWLSMCKQGWAPSMIGDSKGLRSGVEAMSEA
ncbi:MAG: hypothetical protein AB2754_15910 [Candidatus Thiodiazotropha endolucinida]